MNKSLKHLIGNKRLIGTILLIICVAVIGSIAIAKRQKEDIPKEETHTQDHTSQLYAMNIMKRLKEDKENFMAEADFGLCQSGDNFSPAVSEEDVDKFIAENVSDEDESDFYVDRLLPDEYIYTTGYDGVRREVSCWGDSMTYGQASTDVTVPVNGAVTWVKEPTYPSTLQMYSGLTVHNLGITGQTSVEIATRQGGTPMYIDSDIDITDHADTTRVISSYTGGVIDLGDFSGYVDRSNSEWTGSGLCYYEDESGYRLCKVDKSGDICTIQKYNIGNKSAMSDESIVSSYVAEPVHVLKTAIEPADQQKATVENSYCVAEKTEQKTDSAIQSGTVQPTTQAPDNQTDTTQPTVSPTQPQQPTTQQPTTQQPTTQEPTTQQPAIQAPTEADTVPNIPADLSPAHLGAGTVLMTKASVDRKNDLLILEMGSNGGWKNGYQDLIYQYDKMILYSGCKYYIIIGDTDDPAQVRADGVSETGIGIGDTAWEATLRKAYGSHFINMRVELIKNGLQYCGLDTSQADLDGYVDGEISKKLRTTIDNTHLNGFGYYAKGYAVYLKGRELGYW